MKLIHYDRDNNILYIRTSEISPENFGRMGWNQASKIYSMSYEERIEKYADPELAAVIKAELKKHPGCRMSEFTSI